MKRFLIAFAAVLSASAVASPILKDKLVQRGAAVHAPLPQASLTQQLMHAAMAQGDAQLDYAAIIRAVERSARLNSAQK
jgi:hypothetical protein